MPVTHATIWRGGERQTTHAEGAHSLIWFRNVSQRPGQPINQNPVFRWGKGNNWRCIFRPHVIRWGLFFRRTTTSHGQPPGERPTPYRHHNQSPAQNIRLYLYMKHTRIQDRTQSQSTPEQRQLNIIRTADVDAWNLPIYIQVINQGPIGHGAQITTGEKYSKTRYIRGTERV